jgi:hypothetical protein
VPSPPPPLVDSRAQRGDCASCSAVCCVARVFRTSADFPIDKPAGAQCSSLLGDERCRELLQRVSDEARSAVQDPGREGRGADLMGGPGPASQRLRGNSLWGAYLIGTDLCGVHLTTTDLLGTDLRAADVCGAGLSSARFLTQLQVEAARDRGRDRRGAGLRTAAAPHTSVPARSLTRHDQATGAAGGG